MNPDGIILSFPLESGTESRCGIAGKQVGVAAAAERATVRSVKRKARRPRHPLMDKLVVAPASAARAYVAPPQPRSDFSAALNGRSVIRNRCTRIEKVTSADNYHR